MGLGGESNRVSEAFKGLGSREAPQSSGPSDAVPSIRCFVVDDERLARVVLCSQLSRHPDVVVVGQASDLRSAARGIGESSPQVVFLDIGMQEQSGFDLLPGLGNKAPLIVFVTAYEEFAVRAFEVRAIDYLVKPIDPVRLDEALNRLRERLNGAAGEGGVPISEEPLFIQAGRAGCWISPKEITFIQSDRNYSTVGLRDGKRVIVRQTLSSWRSKLPQAGFLQVDRTLILNLQQVSRTDFSGHAGLVYFTSLAEPLLLGRQGTTRLRSALVARPVE